MDLELDKSAIRSAESTRLNSHRSLALKQLVMQGTTGYAPQVAQGALKGWWLVSRHMAGVHSTYVVQNRLKKRFPELAFKVVNTLDDDEKDHNAEIYAIRRTERDKLAQAKEENDE